jgi:hypothetical protein
MRDEPTPGAADRPRRTNVPGDALILAAVDRARRHRHRPAAAVSRWAILEHLALAKRTKAAREVRSRLEELTRAGLLEQRREHGIVVWALTPRGGRELRADATSELPEAPQHRRWREQHEAASQHLDHGRRALERALSETSALLDAEPVASSDAWLLAAIRLYAACRLLAAATYCQHEWPEPDDAHADIDTGAPSPGPVDASPAELATLHVLRVERRRPHNT